MSRSLILCPEKTPVAARAQQEMVYKVDVITPMFGGSSTARKVDPDHPVRLSEIRGCLRFWWRAVRGAIYSDAESLRTREEEIWGSTDRPSPVGIRLTTISNGTTCPARGNPACAVYPFMGDKQTGAEDGLRGASFNVSIRCPSAANLDVRAAVWAWVNFGGIGARTRRGAGALYCANEAPANFDQAGAWYLAKITEFGLPQQLMPMKPWPLVLAAGDDNRVDRSRRPWLCRCKNDLEAWARAVDLISDLRQGVHIGRNCGIGPRPGRSRWPEADSIRALTGKSEPAHKRTITVPLPSAEPGFPRADLGLPLILKFYYQHRGDTPNNCEITPVDPTRHQPAKRMASPVILRPFRMQDNSCYAMVLRLHAPPPEGIRIEFDDKAVSLPHGAVFNRKVLRDRRFAKYPNSPLNKSQSGSAIEALIALAKSRGFQEIR